MLYKPTYANPHLIACDIPFETVEVDGEEKSLPHLTFEFDISGNNCIGYKVYIKNYTDDDWTDINANDLVISFGENATPVTKQTENKVYGIESKSNDKIFILNTVGNNGDKIVFDAFIDGFEFNTKETYQWKVQLYDNSYLNNLGYNVYRSIKTSSVIHDNSYGYGVGISFLSYAKVGMYIRQWVKPGNVLTDSNCTERTDYKIVVADGEEVKYYPIVARITLIKKRLRNAYTYYAYVKEGTLETNRSYWMPYLLSTGRFTYDSTTIDILQDLTSNVEYSYIGYGVIQGVSSSLTNGYTITLQKHYNVRENMLLFVADSDGNYSNTYYSISEPVINEKNQNMTIKLLSGSGIGKGQYYKIYSYFVESDSYIFEYSETPEIDFAPSINKLNEDDESIINVKFPSETFIGSYFHPIEEVVSYNFEIKCEDKVVAQSGDVYSANINFTVDGLIDGKVYDVTMSVTDTKNRTMVVRKSYSIKYVGKLLSSEIKAEYLRSRFCVKLEDCMYTSVSNGEIRRESMVLYRISKDMPLMEKVIEQFSDYNEVREDIVVDYKIGNDMDYQYVAFSDVEILDTGKYSILFDASDDSQDKYEENEEGRFSFCYIRYSSIIHVDCDSYVVMELASINESEAELSEARRYRPKTMWTFRLNLEEGNMVQNLSREQYLTLAKYPKMSKTKRNYTTSSLSCYVGDIDMYEDYIDNKGLLDKWNEFCASDSKKVLKDTKGNLYEIEILNPQYKNELTYFRLNKHGRKQTPTTIQFDWVQIGDMSGEAISVSGHTRTIEELDNLTVGELDGKPIYDIAYNWKFKELVVPENKKDK